MLSVSPHTKRQMVQWYVNIELDKTWKEAAAIDCDVGVLSRYFPKGTWEHYKASVKITGLQAVVLTRDFENRSGAAPSVAVCGRWPICVGEFGGTSKPQYLMRHLEWIKVTVATNGII